jgi:hypothetical protein
MDFHFPTLDLIDRALNYRARPFSQATNADMLERRAREVASEYWSEFAWLTGALGEPAFDRIVAELDALRIDPISESSGHDRAAPVPEKEGREQEPAARAA